MSTAPEPQAAAERQTAGAVVMIAPARLAANPETRGTNRFQTAPHADGRAQAAARREFDALAETLDAAGIVVHGFAGRALEALPDEVFPNNWLSTHADGTLVTYPMAAPSRRRERRADVVDALSERYGITRRLDLTACENEGRFLEGTGSLVLDRVGRVAYACRSARTSPELVARFAAELGYAAELFTAVDADGHALYHTNVGLALGTRFAIVAAAGIADARERARVLARLEAGGRSIVEIGFEQLAAFAGNVLELEGRDGPVIAISRRALASLRRPQRAALERCGRIVAADLDTIERVGGGSVRCMLAEVHLPAKADASDTGPQFRETRQAIGAAG